MRRRLSIDAYAEVWGLFTERLADGIGPYSGPLKRIGMLAADSVRTEAQARQGGRFGIRAFRSAVLESGSLPLGVLDEVVHARLH